MPLVHGDAAQDLAAALLVQERLDTENALTDAAIRLLQKDFPGVRGIRRSARTELQKVHPASYRVVWVTQIVLGEPSEAHVAILGRFLEIALAFGWHYDEVQIVPSSGVDAS